MRYTIEKADDLYCVYKWDKIGWRIIAAYEKLADAKEKIKTLKIMQGKWYSMRNEDKGGKIWQTNTKQYRSGKIRRIRS